MRELRLYNITYLIERLTDSKSVDVDPRSGILTFAHLDSFLHIVAKYSAVSSMAIAFKIKKKVAKHSFYLGPLQKETLLC